MSAPDLLTRAAQCFLLAELTEQISRPNENLWTVFWRVQAAVIPEPVVHLPAMAASVRKWTSNDELDGLQDLAWHPLPARLPPEIIPWHKTLVGDWEKHLDSRNQQLRDIARLALVRLDGCGMPDGMHRPSRLPEWLAEARQIRGTTRWVSQPTLAALAAWRPAPGVVTSPETLREWVAFWLERRQSKDHLMKGIAARALLNLPEPDLKRGDIPVLPTRQLLCELATAVRAAAQLTKDSGENHLIAVDWQPTVPMLLLTGGLAEVVQSWLEVTRDDCWWCRKMAWRQLTQWDRMGILKACQPNPLPIFAAGLRREHNPYVLWVLSQWTPDTDTGTCFLRELEKYWQQNRQSGQGETRLAGWLGSMRLQQAGLASEPPESFLKAYLSAVAQEEIPEAMFVLAQWTPGPDAPPEFHREWRRNWCLRLADECSDIQNVATFALAHQVSEKGPGDAMRRVALATWRAGTKAADVAHRLGSIVSRLHHVETQLATGNIPDFTSPPPPPAGRQCPRLALPPGHIAGGEWKMENEGWRMEN